MTIRMSQTRKNGEPRSGSRARTMAARATGAALCWLVALALMGATTGAAEPEPSAVQSGTSQQICQSIVDAGYTPHNYVLLNGTWRHEPDYDGPNGARMSWIWRSVPVCLTGATQLPPGVTAIPLSRAIPEPPTTKFIVPNEPPARHAPPGLDEPITPDPFTSEEPPPDVPEELREPRKPQPHSNPTRRNPHPPALPCYNAAGDVISCPSDGVRHSHLTPEEAIEWHQNRDQIVPGTGFPMQGSGRTHTDCHNPRYCDPDWWAEEMRRLGLSDRLEYSDGRPSDDDKVCNLGDEFAQNRDGGGPYRTQDGFLIHCTTGSKTLKPKPKTFN